MKSVWVGTDWHVWSVGHTPHHPYQSVSNIRQLSDSYANDIQVDDVFIYLGDLCDPAVTDLNELKRLVQNIPGYKILVKGNHDTETDYFYRDIGFDEVCDVCVINQVAFSHFPLKVEPDMINIHGHLHNEKRSDVDDANHINAYREDYYKHPIEISELIQNAYDKWLKDRAVHKVGEITDAKTGKAYDASRILYLTDIFEEDMLKPVDEAFVGNDEVSTTYLMSLSTVDTEEKLLKWIRQNLHVGPMGKVKTDIEMARSRSASDFDIALFVNPRLRKLGHNPRLMVFIGYEPNNPKPGFVHMFNYWVDLDDSVTWFEASWRGNEGIHEFEDVDDMKTEILSLYRDRIESNKYTETIFHSVNPSYLKPGRDPQEILKDVFGEDGLVNESAAKSEIDKDFIPKEKINLSSLKKVKITEELINKYKKDYPVLRHVRCKDTKEYICDGYLWMNRDNKLVCYVGSCEYTDDHTKWIVSLEILPEFKGHGLSKQILDFATKNMNCKYLSVNKDNKLAKSIYDKYGFKVYTTDDNMYYMTIDPKAKINESFAIGGLPNSIIKVDDQDYSDAGLVSCINWFCDMVQLGSQMIFIKTTNRIRNLWAITEQNSSPLGGRGVDYSYVINLDMVPKNIDKFSLMKFVCLFDILVTTSNQRTIEAGCPNALCAAIAYWYSQPYYDQLFELPEEFMHPSKEVQNWFNMIQCYQRTVNDTAVDLLVRDLFWNKEVDPKILISSALKNSIIACDVNNESAMSQYECLLSLNEVTYDLSKYTDLIVPGTMQSSPFRGKKITSFVDDLLDANIKTTPETIDKIALKQVKSAQDLVDYYNSRLESFTDYSSGSYLGSADVLWTLLFNMNNFSINNWEKFIPTNLSEVEFAQYMNKRFAELDEIEKMYQDIMINNIGAMRLSEAISNAKSKLDAEDSKLCKVSTKKDGTVVYDYGKDLGKVFIGSDVYNDDNDKFKTTIKPSRFFTRVHEYDYIIVTHGKIDGNPNLWEIEHITVDKNACYMVSELLDDIGTDKKVLLLICNPKGRQISGKYKNVTYSTNYILDESAIPSNINIHDTIQTKISIIKTKIKQLQKINKRINTEAVKSTSDVEFGFIVIRNTNKKNLYPYLEYIKENVDFRHRYTHFAINDYIYALESAKTVFKWMDKIYFESMPEAGYYWTYQHSHCPIIMTAYDNPVVGGTVFSTIDECISDARDYLDDIHGSGEYTINVYKAVKGHPLPGQRIRIDESAFINSHDTKEGMTITVPEDDNLNEILMEPEDAHLFLADDEAGEKSQKPYKIKLSTDDQGVIAEDAYQLQGIDRDQQDVISKKYGIRAVGHETEEEIKYREEREKAERERKAEFKKKQKDKQLAKARKTKKKIAKKRELEKRKEEFKSKFNKKNEEVNISDIPYNDGSRNFFDSTPGVANADFVNETGYKFEMLDKVKFFDPINESVDDRTLYPVYVLCVHTGTLLANAIKKATGSHFSHCTISFDSSLKNMYSFGRKTRLTELSNGSFVKESIHNPPYTNEGVTYALYCIPVTGSQLAAMKKRLEYFVKNKTKFRYDFAGLFKNFFGIADNPEQRWFCSRFVADIINAGTEPGQKPMIREPSLMRPEDFLYTNFALYVTSGLIKDYDQILVDKVTKKLLRIESIRRTQQREVQSTNIPVTESAVLDLNPYDPLGEAIFNYQMATMDESAYQNFKKYLHSFKIKLDKDGNIIIHRREVDQLDKYFREANQLLKVNMKAGNEQGVVDQLCRVHYMIHLINKYYLISTTKQNTTVKADLKKQLIDLRSVMINVYQQYLSWVTARNPQFNFQTAYDASIYSDKITVPKEVITSIGRVIMTML
nr:MAG TPA: metallophosphatase domain protein [Bacteriophage sp.]